MAKLIIAEIGQNHLGNMAVARDMIDLARINGADMAKFQLFDSATIVWPNETIHQMAIDSEVKFDQAKMLFQYGEKTGIEVFFSVFDLERVKWCETIGVHTYKIAASRSFDVTLLKAVYATGKDIIQSVPAAVTAKLGESAKTNPCLILDTAQVLYCVAEYPATINHLPRFGDDAKFQGFSDHSIGLGAAKLALAQGARIIEKHFALDHFTGMDSKWAMTPSELLELAEWDAKVKQCA